MPPKRAASGSTAASKRQKSIPNDTSSTTTSPSPAAKSNRWSEVSGTRNIYIGYATEMAKGPEHSYTFTCLCRPPFPNDDEEEDDEENSDEESAEPDPNKDTSNAPPKPRCDAGKTCLCKTLATEHPEHPWSFTRAGLSKFIDLRLCADLRCPDLFDMYTFNDHHGYGVMEVVENLVLDFDEAADGSWMERWAVCEAAVLFMLCGEAEPMNQVDDGERVSHMHTLIARMFLATLAKLEALDMLKPESEVKNLGVIMALYMKYVNVEVNNGIADIATAKKFEFDQAHQYILAYATKHIIALRGPEDIDELVQDLQDEQQEKIKLPRAAKDPWGWAAGLKQYTKDYGESFMGKAIIGGDDLDITTWSSAERKKKSYNGKKDCFSKKEIDSLKAGMILQVR